MPISARKTRHECVLGLIVQNGSAHAVADVIDQAARNSTRAAR